jgi:hypothetical protein
MVLRTLFQDGKGLVADRTHRYPHLCDPFHDRRHGSSRNAAWLLDGRWFPLAGVCLRAVGIVRGRRSVYRPAGALSSAMESPGEAGERLSRQCLHRLPDPPLVLVSFAYAFHTVALYSLLKFVIAVPIALPPTESWTCVLG